MTKRVKKLILILILILAVESIIFSFVSMPLAGNIFEAKKTLVKKESELAGLKDKLAVLKETKANSAETDQIYRKAKDLWPDDKGVSNFIVNLEDLAKSEALTFDSIAIQEATAAKSAKAAKGKSSQAVQFNFNSSGSYEKMMNIIRKLERFDRFNRLTSLNLTTKEADNVAVKIMGEIFYGK